VSWKAWLSGLWNDEKVEVESINVTGFEMKTVNGKVTVLKKNGKPVDPESEEGKALIIAGKASLKKGMDRLDDGMKKLDESMADMDARMKEMFE
tara:strand:- start:7965 stop:8246 length:282 start_codon:yes stop_codon:yes gene_type:complete